MIGVSPRRHAESPDYAEALPAGYWRFGPWLEARPLSLSTMSGVEGLGRSVLPPSGAPPWAGELAGSLDQVGLQVTADNVLGVGRTLVYEADRIERDGKLFGSDAVVQKCGDDPVSTDAAEAFTPRLQALVAQGILVSTILRASAERLADAARAYGCSESDIKAMLEGDTRVRL